MTANNRLRLVCAKCRKETRTSLGACFRDKWPVCCGGFMAVHAEKPREMELGI